MDISDIKKLGLSRIPANASEVTFSEKAGSEGADQDVDKVAQPADVKGAKFKQKPNTRTLLKKKQRLLQVAGANADSLSSADIARLAEALLSK